MTFGVFGLFFETFLVCFLAFDGFRIECSTFFVFGLFVADFFRPSLSVPSAAGFPTVDFGASAVTFSGFESNVLGFGGAE